MGSGPSPLTGFAGAFQRLLTALDLLGIPYLVGGSVASGTYGLPRQTNDIDIVADFSNADLQAFCRSLQAEFYLDTDNAERAVAMGRPFNAIHMKGAFKFDFFPAKSGFTKVELSRKRYIVSSMPGLEKIRFPVSSPEDTILAKLVWFQDGGEVSDRQWHDILGVLSVQSGRLDPDYLSQWASKLGVSDLLRRAFVDLGGRVD